jgi:hypothetical protein
MKALARSHDYFCNKKEVLDKYQPGLKRAWNLVDIRNAREGFGKRN